ncbi:MAG: hypothetical protein R3297_09260, partial [Desulfobulbales bacterium]|nr:hypothetical protein [Desulfobulbales bacterium]
MSSILRALKKLEENPQHLEDHRPLDSKFVPLADTGRQKTQPGIILMVIGGGVACGLVILAGWWLFSAKNQGPPGTIEQIPRQKAQLQEAVPVAPVEPETPASPVISAEPARPPIDISALPRPKVQATEPTAVKLPAPSVSAVAQKEPLPAG